MNKSDESQILAFQHSRNLDYPFLHYHHSFLLSRFSIPAVSVATLIPATMVRPYQSMNFVDCPCRGKYLTQNQDHILELIFESVGHSLRM